MRSVRPLLIFLALVGFGLTERVVAPQRGLRRAEVRTESGRSVEYRGRWKVDYSGVYWFWVDAPPDAELRIDGEPVRPGRGDSGGGWAECGRAWHDLTLRTKDAGTTPRLRWAAEIPVGPRPLESLPVYAPESSRGRLVARNLLRLGMSLLLLAVAVPVAIRSGGRAARTVVFGGSAVILSLALLAAVGELILRAARVAAPAYVPGNVWQLYDFSAGGTSRYRGATPFTIQEFDVVLTTNTHGWRDLERARDKPAGVRRVAIIGDSYVEGREVELSRTMPRLLEMRLRDAGDDRVEVLSFGKAALSVCDEASFTLPRALRFDPDLIVLVAVPRNDIEGCSEEILARVSRWAREVFRERILRTRIDTIHRLTIFPGSRLNRIVAERLARLYLARLHWFDPRLDRDDLVSPELEVFRHASSDPVWERAWEDFFAAVKTIQMEADQGGRGFLLVVVPPLDLEDPSSPPGLDLRGPSGRVRRFCEAEGIACLDLAEAFERHRRTGGARPIWKNDPHWNEVGHAVAAEALRDALIARGW